MTDFEHRHALQQGHEIAASDSYFEARPQIDTNDRRKVFQAGFERGWDRHAALVEAQQPTTHVQNPAEIEHVAGDVSKNGPGSNMAQQPAPSAAAATEVENLRKALQFYADKDHFTIADDGAWDTVSGEPQNYWCDEEGTATVEDGTIARLALAGHQIKFDADAAPQPSPTPQADSAKASPHRPSSAWYRQKIQETLDDDFQIGPAPQADSHPAPVLLSDEELCQIEEPYLLNFRIPLGGQYDFARAVEKAVLAKTYGTQAPHPSPTPQADRQPAAAGATPYPMAGDEDESDFGNWQDGATKPTMDGTYLREFDEGLGTSEFCEGKWLRDGFFPSDIQDARWRGRSAPQPSPTAQEAESRTAVARCTNSDTWNCKYCRKTETCDALQGRAASTEADSQPAPVRCPACSYQHGHAIGCENNPVDISLAAQVLVAAHPPADSVTAPAGGVVVAPSEPTSSMYRAAQMILLPTGDDDGGSIMLNTSQVRALWQAMLAAAPTQTAQAADSVLEDAARLDWLDQQCEAYGFQDIHEGNRWEISGPYANVRVAIDAERAARKQGANHD